MLSEIEILTIAILTIAVSGLIIIYVNYSSDPWRDEYNKFIDLEKEIEEIEKEVYADTSDIDRLKNAIIRGELQVEYPNGLIRYNNFSEMQRVLMVMEEFEETTKRG